MSIAIQSYTSLQAPAVVHDLIEVHSVSQLQSLHLSTDDEFVVLGEGTNVLFVDDYRGTVLVNRMKGVSEGSASDAMQRITASAGENWHALVCAMSARGLYGLENLALIPGTVGAAPVQNIGAYGVEVAEFIESVEVLDLDTNALKCLSHEDCRFGYRDSIFKSDTNRQRYIITSVSFALPTTFTPNLHYKELRERLEGIELTPERLLNTVVDIRRDKLPDYHQLPNAGSFFKNPVISTADAEKLSHTYPDMPRFVVQNGVKIPAAWLIQSAGLKGVMYQGAGIYERHALIVINPGRSSGANVAALAQYIIETVVTKFGIVLEPEVRFIGGAS